MTGSVAAAAPAAAADQLELLTLTKSNDNEVVSPGETFTYTVFVGCNQANEGCIDTSIVDTLPAELEGFIVSGVDVNHTGGGDAPTYAWTNFDETATPAVLAADSVLTVTPQQSLPGGNVGIRVGQGVTVILTLQAPADLEPTWAYNGQQILNPATTTAANSQPATDTAPVTVNVTQTVNVGATKSWAPQDAAILAGTASTITMGVSNASNIPVDTLVIQEPLAAADGATTLDASNAFTITDFTGFGAMTLPEGATSVTADVYVWDDAANAYVWKTGSPSSTAPPALPDGVTNADVAGIRLTYAGESIGIGANASTAINLAQRATVRDTDEAVEATTVNNVLGATASKEGVGEASTDARAHHSIAPANIGANITKNIAPERIQAGASSTATLKGKNNTSTGANTLTISDHGYFVAGEIMFGGFTAAPTAPTTSPGSAPLLGEVTFTSFGGATQTVTIVAGQIPAPTDFGAADVAGFDVVWTAPEGAVITQDTVSEIVFEIDTAEGAARDENPRTTENTASVAITTPYGPASASDKDGLTVYTPSMTVDLTKSVTPESPVRPGDQVLSQLKPTYQVSSTSITPTELVVEDTLALSKDEDNGGFWNAFDLYSIAPTGVPVGTGLDIEVYVNGAWQSVRTVAASSDSQTVSLTHAQLQAALPAGAATSGITGVRFTFDNPNGVSATLIPNLVFEARSEKRDESGPTSLPNEPATSYVNVAATVGTAVDDIGKTHTDDATAEGVGSIVSTSGEGPGVGPDFHIAKDWKLKATGAAAAEPLPALSGDHAWTALYWRVLGDGAEEVTLQDHGTITGVSAGTVYDAFNLTAIEGIGNSGTVGSNGWALRWDKITAIEIYTADGWITPENADSLLTDGNAVDVNADGSNAHLPRIALTPAEQAAATALRITLEPNMDTRIAATAAGTPNVPGINAGVVSTKDNREFRLDWQLRDTLRSNPTEWVTPDTTFNGGANRIDNVVTMTVNDGAPKSAADFIQLVKAAPSVRIDKTATPTAVTVPGEDVAQDQYPTVRFTSTARSMGPAAPSYLRISDPMPCTDTETCGFANTDVGIDGNPYATAPAGGWLTPTGGAASPFDSFTITDVTASVTGFAADLEDSTAWVLRYNTDTGEYTSESMTVNALNGLNAAALVDVVGVTVTYHGEDPVPAPGKLIPESARFHLTIVTQLREDIRSTGDPQQLDPNKTAEVINTSFAQVWDPVLNMTEGDQPSTDTSNAVVTLNGQTIKVAPTKSITPAMLLEVDRNDPVSVTLSAHDGNSQLPPRQVWLKDDINTSTRFWDVFELKALDGPVTAPADADRVAIDLLVGGDWVAGEPQTIADAALPALPAGTSLADADGIRITFSRANGAFLNSADWTTAVPLTFGVRDSYVFPASGEETITNTMHTQSVRDTANPNSPQNSQETTADARIALSSGFFALSVNKLANGGDRSVEVGVAVPWELSFTNTGTGALTITKLVDYLGDSDANGVRVPDSSHLVPGTPTNLMYETSAGGTLATEDITYAYDPEKDEIVWTWPEGGNTMAPGETFTITLDIALLPGLQSGQHAVNSMIVHTEQTLNGGRGPGGTVIPPFVNSDPTMQNNPNNGSWGGATEAGTKDYVQPRTTLNLWTQKAVYGSLGTATANGEECSASVPGPDGQDYFPSPCLSDTQYSAGDDIVDKWLLRTSNTTTTAVKELVLFDDLPIAGDKFLIGGAGRGSDYRSVLTAQPQVHLPAGVGATTVIEVTSTPDACQDTWGHIVANPGAEPCEQADADWTTADDSTEWSEVTGLRMRIVFDEATPLGNGQTVDVTFETYNIVDAAADTQLSRVVPVPEQEAWNQFGIQWQFANGNWSQRIPAEVGVTPQAGPLQIEKFVDGPAAAFAPATFTFEVKCSITQPGGYETTALTMPNGGVVTVTRGDNGTYEPARIDGIPLGADCTVVETDKGGATSSTVEPATVKITEPADAEGNVPAAQVVTATNTFDVSSLEVTKQVTGAGAAYGTGPFELQAVCTFNGLPVDLADDGVITLPIDGAWTATLGDIPIGAECVVTETEDGGATSTTVAPERVTITAGESGEFAAVTVTNEFELGGLQIFKELDGAGSGDYGTGPFTFATQCTFEGAPVDLGDSGTVSLPTADGQWSTVIGGIPVGAECVVSETTAGGATGTEMYPNDGTVTIPAPGDGETPVVAAVSATNTFDVGALQLTKVVAGSGAAEYGDGPFEFQTQCLYEKDGELLSISLPDGGAATLPTADGAWSITYDNLIVGAECVVVETDAAGANAKAMSPADGTVVIPPLSEGQAQTALVTATNTFEVGQVAVEKLVDGPFGLDSEELTDLTFTVSWVASNGESGALELNADSTWAAITKDLPVGTTVTLTEVEIPEFAPHVGFTGFTWVAADGVTVSPDGTEATVVVGAEPVQLQVENAFVLKTGTFEITKLIDGDFSAGSEEMRDRTFAVTWTAGDRTGTIELNAENGWTAGPDAVFPVGSTVELAEAEITGLPPHVQFEQATWTAMPGLTVAEDGTATLTVGEGDAAQLELTNEFTLLTGTFGVEKLITGDFAQDAPEFADLTFVVDYSVSDGQSGQLELNAAGNWTADAGQFPTGATVTLTEVAVDQGDLAPHVTWDGYTWAVGDGYEVSADGLTATLVVGDDTRIGLELENAFTELLGSFAVQKVVDGDFALTDPQLSDLVFEVAYTVSTGETGTLELSADNGWTAAPEDVFRTGSTVTLTEVAPTGMGPSVQWDGYSWLAGDGITVSEDGQTATITVGDGDAVRLQVENAFTELVGSFGVAKVIEGDFAATDAEMIDRTFTVAYEAINPANGEVTTGELALTADGGWQAAPGVDFAAGTEVTLTEVEVTGLPPHVQWDGYRWLAADGVTVSEDGLTATIVVGADEVTALQVENTFTELLGGFAVTKDVAGEGAERVPADLEFTVEYSIDGGETWVALPAVTKDSPFVAGPDDIRLGTEVLIREVAPAELPSVEWGTPAFSGTGVTPGVDGAPASFVISDVDSRVDVLLTNPTTPLNGQFQVTKKITGAGSSLVDGDPIFTVRYAAEGQDAVELTVRAGEVVSSAPIPAGTVVTIEEVLPEGGLVEGASWGTPVFVLEDGTVLTNGSTITIGADTVLALLLENPTVPPLPPTGGQLPWLAGILAVLLVGVGAAMVIIARRRGRTA